MNYIALPLARIEPGKPVPINIWDPKGNLLLRKGQVINSEQHKEMLAAHQASATEVDYKAWQRSYDRQVYAMFRSGASVDEIAKTYMPSVILDVDYAVGHEVVGGWLDLHAVLGALLYQGPLARNPLDKLDGIRKRADELLRAGPDAALFDLFQALSDRSIAYCAKHALLSAALCELTARKLQVPELLRAQLFEAALLMNIGMAKEQDELATQTADLSPAQRRLVHEHPVRSADILRGFGLVNEDLLDMVRWHHTPGDVAGLSRNLECKQILCLCDQFIAKMAARSTRNGMSAASAAKIIVTDTTSNTARIGSALTAVVGFYPPGTYLALSNGETAVSVRRGATANTPVVVSILSRDGMALGQYVGRDTRDKQFAARVPVSPERLKLRLDGERIERAAGKVASTAG